MTTCPPATHYRLGSGAAGFYAEFLTPLAGPEITRTGKRKATAHVAGVNSQQLRFIDILLAQPWTIELSPTHFSLTKPRTVQIANPVAYLAQKLLIHKKRPPAGRAKDILYIHDTLQTFGARLDELSDEWNLRILPHLHRNHAKTVATAADWLFADLTDPIRAAATIAVDRRLTPESIRQSCRYGLQQILAPAAALRTYTA